MTMHYLFGFGGRINRARMWLFILVTLGWEIVIGLVAAAGLRWTGHSDLATVASRSDASGGTNFSASLHILHPAPVSNPVEWTAAGIIAVLMLLYAVALCAVYTKRLHDRGKSAWWLLPFLVIPWGLGILKCLDMPGLLQLGPYFGPLGMGWDAAALIGTILGIWAFIELFFFRGSIGANRYGPDPLSRPAA